MLLLILDPPLFSHCFIVSCSCSFRVPNCNTWCESSCQGWGIQEYHIGDEDTNESTMSRLTNLDCFTGGDFEEYAERLQFYFLANDVGKLGSSPSPAEKHAADRKKAAQCPYFATLRNGVLHFEKSMPSEYPRHEGLCRANHTAQRLLQARNIFSNSDVSV